MNDDSPLVLSVKRMVPFIKQRDEKILTDIIQVGKLHYAFNLKIRCPSLLRSFSTKACAFVKGSFKIFQIVISDP